MFLYIPDASISKKFASTVPCTPATRARVPPFSSLNEHCSPFLFPASARIFSRCGVRSSRANASGIDRTRLVPVSFHFPAFPVLRQTSVHGPFDVSSNRSYRMYKKIKTLHKDRKIERWVCFRCSGGTGGERNKAERLIGHRVGLIRALRDVETK